MGDAQGTVELLGLLFEIQHGLSPSLARGLGRRVLGREKRPQQGL